MLLKLILVLAFSASILFMVNTSAFASHYSTLQDIDKAEYKKKIQEIRELDKKPSPLHQIKDGIHPKDVLCDKELRLVLKWSGDNVACVDEKFAKRLVKINWGVERAGTVFPVIDEKCDTVYEVMYYNSALQNEFKIIKSIRTALQEVKLGQEYDTYNNRMDYVYVHTALVDKPSWIVIQHMSLDDNDQEYGKIFNAIIGVNSIKAVNSVKVICS